MSEPVIRAAAASTDSMPVKRRMEEPVSAAAASGNVESTTGKELPAIEKAEIELLVEELNTSSQSIGRDLRFQVDLDSRRSVIQVLDRETGEVIRQIPPEKVTAYIDEYGGVAINLLDDLV